MSLHDNACGSYEDFPETIWRKTRALILWLETFCAEGTAPETGNFSFSYSDVAF